MGLSVMPLPAIASVGLPAAMAGADRPNPEQLQAGARDLQHEVRRQTNPHEELYRVIGELHEEIGRLRHDLDRFCGHVEELMRRQPE